MKKMFLTLSIIVLVSCVLLMGIGCKTTTAESTAETTAESTAETTAESTTATTAETTEGVVTLNFTSWEYAEEASKGMVEKVIAAFEAENPNIKINVVPVPFSETRQQLVIMVSGGNAPDVAEIEPSTGSDLAIMGALAPVDDLLSADFIADLDKVQYDLALYEGKHYFTPWGVAPYGFFYNKKIMADAGIDSNNPPQTMEELNTQMEAIVKIKDVVPLQYDTTIRPFSINVQWPFMLSFGKAPFDNETVQVNSMNEYAEWLRNLVKKRVYFTR
ncbi:MAG: extracellular solute-binding protein [Actinobacteria bacterium]|nr:extracellular solute-binding protein [Actinomycetota bacterium]